MSEAKFTNGEWRVDDYLGIDGSIRVMFGNILITYHGHATEEDIANAHLIAAAPEMYKHIKQDIEILKRQCKNHVIGSYELKSLHLRIESKQKLLAKARGEHE